LSLFRAIVIVMTTSPEAPLSATDTLTMALAVAYYTPLGWALDDGEEVDPDDLAECLKAMTPVAALVRDMLAQAWDKGSHATAYSGVTYTDNPFRGAP
jgi:hypothetical protein